MEFTLKELKAIRRAVAEMLHQEEHNQPDDDCVNPDLIKTLKGILEKIDAR